MNKKRLRDYAYGRSGDKGGSANIGVIAYTKKDYEFLENYLTEQVVHNYFCHLGVVKTTRYTLPNLLAFNFVLENVLQGGGIHSLRSDAQGKGLAQQLLEMEVVCPTL